MPVYRKEKKFVIFRGKQKQLNAAVESRFGRDTLSNNVEPVLKYKDGTNQICHGEIIVKLKNGFDLKDIFNGYQYTFTLDSFMSNTYYVKLRGKNTYNIFELIDKLNDNDGVIYAEPDFIRMVTPCTSDPYYTSQWAIKNTGSYYGGTVGADMNVEKAWNLSTGSNVKVAIIDEGVQLDHPDLVNNLLTGYDATGNNSAGGPNISNHDAHGTNCAGIVAAIANNNIGVAGIAYNAKVIPIRIAYDSSYPINDSRRGWITQDSWMAAGINYAYNTAKADILSNSWGGAGSPSSTIDAAINSAVTYGRNGKGCVVLFAAGNRNSSVQYPASNSNVIAVGASSMCDTRKRSSSNVAEVSSYVSTDPLGTSCDGEAWWGSNYGTGLDVVAPGVKVYSTDLTGDYGYSTGDYDPIFNGTSSATPNVAGVAALILSLRPDYTGTQVRQTLESTCDKIGGYPYQFNVSGQPNGTWCNDVGYGRINAYAALSSLISGPSTVYSSATFSIASLPSGATVTWSIAPSGGTLYVISQNNETAVIGNHGWYGSTFTVNATITGLSSTPIVLSKTVMATTGCPSISATYTIQPCYNQNGIYDQTANLDGTANYVYYGCPVGTTFTTSSTISCQLLSGAPSVWFFSNNYLYMATSNPTIFKINFAGDDGGLCSKTVFFYPTGAYHTYSLLASPNPTSSVLNVSITTTATNNDVTAITSVPNVSPQLNSVISLDDISKQNTIIELYEFSTNQLAQRWRFADGLAYQLNVSSLRRGIYIMKVYKGNLQLASKVVLK